MTKLANFKKLDLQDFSYLLHYIALYAYQFFYFQFQCVQCENVVITILNFFKVSLSLLVI